MADLGGFLSAAGVGSAIGQAVVQLDLDTRKYQTELAAAEGKTTASANSMSSGLKSFQGFATAAFAGAATAVVAFATTSVKAALEANEAHLKLQNTFANNARLADSSVEAFEAQADALRDLTGVDDEAIITAQALLGQFDLTGQQVQALIPRIIDLSEKMDIDLVAAAKAVGKATQGNTAGLQRYGIVIDETAGKGSEFASTLEGLGIVAGFAADQADAEPWRVLSAQVEELQETVGQALIPVLQGLVPVVQDVVKILQFATGATEGFDRAVQDATLHLTHFELGIASFFERFGGHIPIIGEFVKAWDAVREAQDAVRESTALNQDQIDTLTTAIQSGDPTYLAFRDHWVGIFDTFLGGTGKVEAANAAFDNGTQIVQNFLGVLPGFESLLGGVGDAAQNAGEDVRRFAHMTGKELKDWKTSVNESIESYIFNLDDLSRHAEQTKKEFIEAHRAMLARAKETNKALIEIRNEDWVNPNYIAFLADQGPEALINFAGLNDEKQLRMQQAWKETTRLTDKSGDSVNAIIGVLDNLDNGHTRHEVEIHYTYSGFDPSKPGMGTGATGGNAPFERGQRG